MYVELCSFGTKKGKSEDLAEILIPLNQPKRAF
jgi:hypothetical protein